jgi:hypothetical protein
MIPGTIKVNRLLQKIASHQRLHATGLTLIELSESFVLSIMQKYSFTHPRSV